jgi:hypothetical protein
VPPTCALTENKKVEETRDSCAKWCEKVTARTVRFSDYLPGFPLFLTAYEFPEKKQLIEIETA